MDKLTRVSYAEKSWAIEVYHRGIKPHCGVERSQARGAKAQKNHIGLALRAFVRLETDCFHKGVSGFEAKTHVIRSAVRAYLQQPLFVLPAQPLYACQSPSTA